MVNQLELIHKSGDIEVEETRDDDDEKKGKKKSLAKMMRVTICELEAALKVHHMLYTYLRTYCYYFRNHTSCLLRETKRLLS